MLIMIFSLDQGNNLKQPGAWNDRQRWEGLDELGLRAPCVVVEFGMNNGLDTRDLLRKTPCKIYTYELLPRFQGKGVEVSTRDVVSEMHRLFGSDPHWTVDLLHSNCKGCEYSVFDMLHRHGLLSRFSVLQYLHYMT
eukprot:m51a1_g11561 hypothetical protein (137) ;mRNA; f:303-10181